MSRNRVRRPKLRHRWVLALTTVCIVLLLATTTFIWSYIHYGGNDENNPSVIHVVQNGSAFTQNEHDATMTTKLKISGTCNDGRYGRVGVAVMHAGMPNAYRFAQQTLECYINRTGYELMIIDVTTDVHVRHACRHAQIFFIKHCAASLYLSRVDWLLVLDADTGVVNMRACIEDYIDPTVQLIFYERFFNWEIAAGNYIARNTRFARQFLMEWADYEFAEPASGYTSADNGALQVHMLKTLLPNNHIEIDTCNRLWYSSSDFDTYMRYVTCCKVSLGARRRWPPLVLIYRRAHGWVLDNHITNEHWCDDMFMMHGWKKSVIDTNWSSPFTHAPEGADCELATTRPWPWRAHLHVSCERVRKMLRQCEAEKADQFPNVARILPYLEYVDIGLCWPKCEH